MHCRLLLCLFAIGVLVIVTLLLYDMGFIRLFIIHVFLHYSWCMSW
jgi:hypothetical protein